MDISAFLDNLDILFNDKKYDEIETYLKNGIEKANKEKDLGAELSICNELGGFYRICTRFPEAKRAFERALEIVGQLGLEDQEPYAVTALNLATMLAAANEPFEAIQYFEKALLFLEQNQANGYLLASAYNNLIGLYIRETKFEKAEECGKRAIFQIEKLPNTQEEQAVTHSLLAQIYLMCGKIKEAENECLISYHLFGEAENPSAVHKSALCSTQGQLFIYKKMWRNAETVLKEAVLLQESSVGDTKNMASILDFLVLVENQLGNHSAANEYQKRADGIRERAL